MHLPQPQRHLPLLNLPALLLSVVYAAAVAVALTAPGRHSYAGAVVLIGLVARWALRHRHRAPAPVPLVDGVRPADSPAPAA